jgi:hypothetical protein
MFHKGLSSKREILTGTILSMLLASALITGLSFANLAQANPYLTAFQYFDIEPVTDPPIVSLVSPTNGAPWNGTSIIFTVSMPDSWKWAANAEAAAENWSVFVGQIKSVTCSLDQTQILKDNTVYGRQEIEPLRDYHPRVFTYSKDVGSLPLGSHTLTVNVEAYTLYRTMSGLWYNASASSTFTFTVEALPAVASLVTAVAIAIIASTTLISFGLVTYFLKRKRTKDAA